MESPPPVPVPIELSEQDTSHLSLLAIFHYVLAGLTFVFGSIPIVHLVIGLVMLTNPDGSGWPAPQMLEVRTHEEMQEEVLFGEEGVPPQFKEDAAVVPQGHSPKAVFQTVGGAFVAISVVLILAAWTLAVLLIAGGRSLQKRKRHLFCQVVAGLSCFLFPFGTVLGVFTILVLQKPAVATVFKRAKP